MLPVPPAILEKLDPPQTLARDFFLPALDRGSRFAFPDLGRLLVEFAPMYFSQNACLLTSALEAPQGEIKRFVISNLYTWHR